MGIIKDIIVSLVAFPTKKILMYILIVDIHVSYMMLFERYFEASMVRMISLDKMFTQIPIRDTMQILQPKIRQRFMMQKEGPDLDNNTQNIQIEGSGQGHTSTNHEPKCSVVLRL